MRKNKNNELQRKSFREKAAELLEMPKEMFGMPKIVIYGKKEISVENFESLLEYSNIKIRLKTKMYHLTINGKSLGIRGISPDVVRIYGEITNIEFT